LDMTMAMCSSDVCTTSVHHKSLLVLSRFFFFRDTATTDIYTLSLHDALPISSARHPASPDHGCPLVLQVLQARGVPDDGPFDLRSEEHTSELQSRSDLVCRLLLEKKKINPPLVATNTSMPSTCYLLSNPMPHT